MDFEINKKHKLEELKVLQTYTEENNKHIPKINKKTYLLLYMN